ncbi:helix-turn-helix domain-containing protein [Streptomyces sp. NPDC019443]|uniref:AraC-like ligand-binding domain-containing protein n=1 Tax=Streptomyces sp. NPDC019443 TaxID=3365061 RepID=UPI0037AB7C75
MSLVLSTDSVPAADRFAYRHDVISKTCFPLRMNATWESFCGTIVTDRIGFLLVSSVAAEAEHVDPARCLSAQSEREDFITVGLQREGSAVVTQDNRSAALGPGDFVLYDAIRPYQLAFPERFRMTFFQIPRRAFGVRNGEINSITGTAIRGDDGVASVVSRVLEELSRNARDYDPEIAEMLARNTVDLLATVIAEQLGRDAMRTDAAKHALMLRVRGFIRRNLAHADLCPKMIAAAHHISVRYLYRLFEKESKTIGRLILEWRLEECRRDLARPAHGRPSVTVIAHRWGFQNPAHFSRSFRAAYGMSPREWQAFNDSSVPDSSVP